MLVEELWDELEALLLAQQRAGTTIDSVVMVGPGKDDKIIVKGRPGALKVVPCELALWSGMTPSSGYASIQEAVTAARTAASACGLRPLRVRFGKGKNPNGVGRSVSSSPLPRPIALPSTLPPVVTPVTSQLHVETPAAGPATEFVTFAREKLRDILGVSGQVLYSGASTLRKGDVYLLGLNPGGDPTNPSLKTIGQSLDDLVSDEPATTGVPRREWNSYVHATWKGRDTLQRRILWLLEQFDLDPLKVAASNLIFPRSRDEKSLRYEAYADLCWTVHERVLEVVRPRWVITYGGTPYRYLGERLGGVDEQRFPSGHGDWDCRSFDVPGRFRVIGVPHMSLYAIDQHPEVVEWIRGR